ncbi:MAG: ferrochelatase [Actinomycetota bacterium]
MNRVGVLVMAYGTPTTPEDVETYYTRIRHGRPPTPEQLTDLTRRYNAIGGISPLAERTAAQVDGIRQALELIAPGEYAVRFGSKYEPPMLEETASSFAREGFDRVVGLVLAPQSSMSTVQYMSRASAALDGQCEFIQIGAWWDDPIFVQLIADRVRAALATIPIERHSTTEVIFSAHSLPTKILDAGDTYPEQLRESARMAASLAGITAWDIAWQSAGRTADPWIGPDILDVLRQKKANGVSDVVSCPIGFVSDHLEVLFDIDIEARAVADEIGLGLVRTASLNADPVFLLMLADLVRRNT